jgi:hypothetical protein
MISRCEFVSTDDLRSFSLKDKDFYQEYLKRTIYYNSYKDSCCELIRFLSLTDNNFVKDDVYEKIKKVIKNKYS